MAVIETFQFNLVVVISLFDILLDFAVNSLAIYIRPYIMHNIYLFKDYSLIYTSVYTHIYICIDRALLKHN